MLVLLQGVLAPEDIARLRKGLAGVHWQDGGKTAGAAAKAVKANEQARQEENERALARFVSDALARHVVFCASALPSRPLKLLFSRYRDGMAYGLHNDDALMGEGGGRIRTDFAVTLFLADPQSYEGGALILDGPAGEQRIKLAAGDACVYAAGALHRVEPVASGERLAAMWRKIPTGLDVLAAIAWGQSLIRDAGARAILFDLAQARWALPAGSETAALRLDQVHANLIRRWADP